MPIDFELQQGLSFGLTNCQTYPGSPFYHIKKLDISAVPSKITPYFSAMIKLKNMKGGKLFFLKKQTCLDFSKPLQSG